MKKIIFMMGVLFVFMGCSENVVTEQKQKVKVFRPEVKDTSYTKEFVAELKAKEFAEVRALVAGLIEKVHVSEGAKVSKGQVLVSLNKQAQVQIVLSAKSTVKEAEALYNTAQLKYDNAKKLRATQVLSQAELDVLESEKNAALGVLESERAQLAYAETCLKYTEITAPFDGVVGRFLFKVGSLVQEGEILTTLANDAEVFAYFNIPEVEYLSMLRDSVNILDQRVQFVLASNEAYPISGEVIAMNNAIDPETGTIGFKAKFQNLGMLHQGGSGKVRVEMPLGSGLFIPQKSVLDIQGELFVLSVDQEGMVKREPIHPIGRIPHYYVLASEGLDTKSHFLFEGIQMIAEGDKVETEVVQIF